MKFLKIFCTTVIAITLSTNLIYSAEPSTELSELNFQLVKEVKRNVESPLLSYSDKNLLGVAVVTAEVKETGKINFVSVSSTNTNLKRNIERKLEYLNLWTDPKQNGKVFVYTINYKER